MLFSLISRNRLDILDDEDLGATDEDYKQYMEADSFYFYRMNDENEILESYFDEEYNLWSDSSKEP